MESEDCVQFITKSQYNIPINGRWNDVPCAETNEFICQKELVIETSTGSSIESLKYGFCKKSLRKNEALTSCPFFSFFYHFWLGATANPTKSDKKMKKGATGQSFIRKEVSSYKIHTLAALMCKKLDVPLDP